MPFLKEQLRVSIIVMVVEAQETPLSLGRQVVRHKTEKVLFPLLMIPVVSSGFPGVGK